jgi:heme exporter protein D
VEITPQNIRLRKRLLDENDRKKARSQRSAESAPRREAVPA